jgi:transcriptional regulator with XRE-family HTH domain
VEKDSTTAMDGIPERLNRLRNRAGLTRQELADRAGLTFNTINDLEKGRRPHPMEKTLQCIANALGVPYDYLVFGRTLPVGAGVEVGTTPRASNRRFRWALAVAGVALLTVAALHLRWERDRSRTLSTCVSKWTVEGPAAVKFEDIDGDNIVEKIESAGGEKVWRISKVSRLNPDTWEFTPALTRQFDDTLHITTRTYDLNEDGVKDLLNLCVNAAGARIDVIDGADGALMTTISDVPAGVGKAGMLWNAQVQIVNVGRSPAHDTDVIVVSANDAASGDGVVLCSDMRTGRELWRYESTARLRATRAIDFNQDGDPEVIVLGSVPQGTARYGGAGAKAFAAGLNETGEPAWYRPLSTRCAQIVGCLLEGDANEPPLLFCAVNSSGRQADISRILLLDPITGALVDSLPYTDLIVQDALAHKVPDIAEWNVFCGTEHGVIRKYSVKNDHIRIAGERWLDRNWAWPAAFVAGNEFQDAFIVATADHHAYILDGNLNILLNRSGVMDVPITPLASFADPDGRSYVSYLCHGKDVCIDRISSNSGWGIRKWYILGYLLSIGVVLGGSGRELSWIRFMDGARRRPRPARRT